MKAIPYWIQRADFSATDYDPVEIGEAVRAFESHNWPRELAFFSDLERAGTECCPPGIGFVDQNGQILHICPRVDGSTMVHYHFTVSRKLLGLIPISESRVETKIGVYQSDVPDLIRSLFEGRHEWMLHKLAGEPRATLADTQSPRP
jgi:hypothetical protein